MNEKEKIDIARIAIRKNLDLDTLRYSDYLYGEEDQADDVWEYVVECREIGTVAFDEKYGL